MSRPRRASVLAVLAVTLLAGAATFVRPAAPALGSPRGHHYPWGPRKPSGKVHTTKIADGLWLTRIVQKKVPRRIFVLTVDLSTALTTDVALSNDSLPGFERPTSMAKRHGAIAAINGDFGLRSGRPAHSFAEDGELKQTQFAFGQDTAVTQDDTRVYQAAPGGAAAVGEPAARRVPRLHRERGRLHRRGPLPAGRDRPLRGPRERRGHRPAVAVRGRDHAPDLVVRVAGDPRRHRRDPHAGAGRGERGHLLHDLLLPGPPPPDRHRRDRRRQAPAGGGGRPSRQVLPGDEPPPVRRAVPPAGGGQRREPGRRRVLAHVGEGAGGREQALGRARASGVLRVPDPAGPGPGRPARAARRVAQPVPEPLAQPHGGLGGAGAGRWGCVPGAGRRARPGLDRRDAGRAGPGGPRSARAPAPRAAGGTAPIPGGTSPVGLGNQTD